MILARHAESLFWAGRYLERAEVTSRWLDVANRFTMNLLAPAAEEEWRMLVDALSANTQVDEAMGGGAFDQAAVSISLLTDPTISGSVLSAIELARDNLRVVRDRVPVELWEEVNRLHMSLGAAAEISSAEAAPHHVFRAVREGCQAISGVISESMMRDEGHALIVIGRMIERSISTVRLLRAACRRPEALFDSDRMLRSSSALQAYRRLHGHEASAHLVTAFLLQTPGLPRSVQTCVQNIEEHLLTLDPGAISARRTQQLAGRMRSRLEYGDLDIELDNDADAFLGDLEAGLFELSASLSTDLFRPVGEPVLHAQFVRPGLGI